METTTIRLSEEELIIFMEFCGIDEIGGVSPEKATSTSGVLSNNNMREVLVRVLLARGLILPMIDGSYKPEGTVKRLLQMCATPEAILFLTSRVGDAASLQQEIYFRVGTLFIRHYFPFEAIHDFTILGQPPDFEALMLQRLKEYSFIGEDNSLSVGVPQTVMSDVQKNIDERQEQNARDKLQKVIGATDGEVLLKALAKPTIRLYLQTLSIVSSEPLAPMTLICDKQHCFQIHGESENVFITGVSVNEIRDRIVELIHLFIA